MKKYQYNRWKEFTLQMAKTAFRISPARKERLVDEIENMFFYIENDGRYRGYRGKKWGWREIKDWDSDFDGMCFCDWIDQFFEEFQNFDKHGNQKENKFFSMLTCCIRAGLDMASAPSGGVVGFQKQDIINMYPAGVPGYLQQGWGEAWEKIPVHAGLWL